MKNYVSVKNAINKYYNSKIKEVKSANKIYLNRWVENPTEKQKNSKIKEIEKERNSYLYLLDKAKQAPELTLIKINVSWGKSRTWGYNPKAESWVNGGFYGLGRASGCGYDKLSAAIGESLVSSDSLNRFIIENYSKLKNLYGLSNFNGFPRLSISGKGDSVFLEIFKTYNEKVSKNKRFVISENHGDCFDCYNITKLSKI